MRTIRSSIAAFQKWLRYKPKIVEKEVEREIEKIVEKRVEVPVEVVKEVPVEKIVFRDKPITVVKKEYVHVPLYTNDVELLGKVERETK